MIHLTTNTGGQNLLKQNKKNMVGQVKVATFIPTQINLFFPPHGQIKVFPLQ